jgi:hypothetical protein
VLRVRLADPHERGGALDQGDAEREAEVVLDRGGEGLRRRDHQRLRSGARAGGAELQREHAVAERELARDRPQRLGRLGLEPPDRGLEPDALREQRGQRRFMDRGELQRVGGEVPAVEDLAGDRLLDRAHGGGPALHEERAQRRHRRLFISELGGR